jgi:hypothetical protein
LPSCSQRCQGDCFRKKTALPAVRYPKYGTKGTVLTQDHPSLPFRNLSPKLPLWTTPGWRTVAGIFLQMALFSISTTTSKSWNRSAGKKGLQSSGT